MSRNPTRHYAKARVTPPRRPSYASGARQRAVVQFFEALLLDAETSDSKTSDSDTSDSDTSDSALDSGVDSGVDAGDTVLRCGSSRIRADLRPTLSLLGHPFRRDSTPERVQSQRSPDPA